MNQKLIKQVQEGTGCIEHTKKVKDSHKLNKVISECFSEVRYIDGMFGYYFASTSFEDGWDNDDMAPTGLTPIPLDDFFKEETSEQRINREFIEELIEEGKPATPEQPSLPEGKEVGNIFDFVPEVEVVEMDAKCFFDKTKGLLTKIANYHIDAYETKRLKDEDYPEESVCGNCKGFGEFEGANCQQDKEDGSCFKRVFNAEYFAEEMNQRIGDIYELLSITNLKSINNG